MTYPNNFITIEKIPIKILNIPTIEPKRTPIRRGKLEKVAIALVERANSSNVLYELVPEILELFALKGILDFGNQYYIIRLAI